MNKIVFLLWYCYYWNSNVTSDSKSYDARKHFCAFHLSLLKVKEKILIWRIFSAFHLSLLKSPGRIHHSDRQSEPPDKSVAISDSKMRAVKCVVRAAYFFSFRVRCHKVHSFWYRAGLRWTELFQYWGNKALWFIIEIFCPVCLR